MEDKAEYLRTILTPSAQEKQSTQTPQTPQGTQSTQENQVKQSTQENHSAQSTQKKQRTQRVHKIHSPQGAQSTHWDDLYEMLNTAKLTDKDCRPGYDRKSYHYRKANLAKIMVKAYLDRMKYIDLIDDIISDYFKRNPIEIPSPEIIQKIKQMKRA